MHSAAFEGVGCSREGGGGEGATAAEAAAYIFMDAYDKRVVLVSNTTLLSTLRVVSELWQFDDQKRNVLEIAKQSGLLYDKFEGFVSDLIKVGNNINSSQHSYQDAMNKLSEGKGNLVSKVENLKKLGAKTKKNLPQKLLDRSNQ